MRVATAVAIGTSCVLVAGSYRADTIEVPADESDIVAAVAAALPGDTIVVSPGSYAGDIWVDKPLALLGPNASVDACTGTRVPEATILGELRIAADDVTLDGFRFTGSVGFGASVTQDPAALSTDRATLRNNLFEDVGTWAVYHSSGGPTSTGWVCASNRVEGWLDPNGTALLFENMDALAVRDNCVSDAPVTPSKGSRGIGIDTVTGAEVTGNTVRDLDRWGLQLADSFGPQVGATISGNTVRDVQVGIQLVGLGAGNGIDDALVANNQIADVTAIGIWVTHGSGGSSSFGDVEISDNRIDQDVGALVGDFGLLELGLDGAAAPHGTLTVARNQVRFAGSFGAATAAYGIKARGALSTLELTGNVLDGGEVGSGGGAPPTSGLYLAADDASLGPIPGSATVLGSSNKIFGWVHGVSVYDPVAAAFGGLAAGADVALESGLVAGNSGLGIASGPGAAIDAVDNWWGDASGPADPAGSSEADTSTCFGASVVSNTDGLGNGVTDAAVEYCPWATGAGTLRLEVAGACLNTPQIEVELHARDLLCPTTGYQAFLTYPTAELAYRGDLSAYGPGPLSLHIQPLVTAEVATGELRLDGSVAFGAGATEADELLATLVFDVVSDCSTVTVDFDPGQVFASELSAFGEALPTLLVDTPAFQVDPTPPVLSGCPPDLVQPADAGIGDGCTGAVVSFAAPTALDDCDGFVPVTCTPPSGSVFPVGTTVVVCEADDLCGNTASCTFDVTVTATNLVELDVRLDAVSQAATRCIQLVPDDCGSGLEVSLAFDGTGLFSGVVELPCGPWTNLCAKDRQHTLWDSSGLVLSGDGTRWVATSELLLEGGDTDDDGNVDINDVTFFMIHFGDLAASGGCPWDGTRDADFDLNGAMGSEDYAFLSSNWLTATACPCSFALGPHRSKRTLPVRSAAEAAVDFDGNGRIDFADVELFEAHHELSGTLSRRMRESVR